MTLNAFVSIVTRYSVNNYWSLVITLAHSNQYIQINVILCVDKLHFSGQQAPAELSNDYTFQCLLWEITTPRCLPTSSGSTGLICELVRVLRLQIWTLVVCLLFFLRENYRWDSNDVCASVNVLLSNSLQSAVKRWWTREFVSWERSYPHLIQSQTRQAMYVWHNTEVRFCKHCCMGKAISTSHLECAFVALVIQHAMRMSSVACQALQHFYTLSHKRQHDFRKKNILNSKYVFFLFSLQHLSEKFLILRRTEQDTTKLYIGLM